jgi:hypothetical protein
MSERQTASLLTSGYLVIYMRVHNHKEAWLAQRKVFCVANNIADGSRYLPGSPPSNIGLRILEKRTLMSMGFSSPGTLKAFEPACGRKAGLSTDELDF